jgi:acyl-CoA thioester hydrolase
MKNDYPFSIEMVVRDYELDLQGIVNNSVYQNYIEHARHEYIKKLGINFKEYSQKGINFVVVRAELDYKFPLTSGDKFWVGVQMNMESPVKFAFYEDIYRSSDDKLILKAKIIGTALNSRGRPQIPDEVRSIFTTNVQVEK